MHSRQIFCTLPRVHTPPNLTLTREKNFHAKQTPIAQAHHQSAASAEAARGKRAPSQLELAPVLAIQCCRLARQVPQAARAAGVDGHAAALRKLRRAPPVFSEAALLTPCTPKTGLSMSLQALCPYSTMCRHCPEQSMQRAAAAAVQRLLDWPCSLLVL